jgi:hypothetical protein
MKTKATILDFRDEGSSKCFLCRMTLSDYVSGLPSTYQDYDVQREIVSNVYLDHLVETVVERRHIPPIVLMVDAGQFEVVDGNNLLIDTFKILDGLQRTYRLQAIRETFLFALNNVQETQSYLDLSKFKFSQRFSAEMRVRNSNTDVLRVVLNSIVKEGKAAFESSFESNFQWFEIWTGLSPQEEVRKMLTLNAGHKPVKTRHQLELLFLNLLPILRKGEEKEFRLVREKDIGSMQFSKERKCGDFHFAHIISAFLSFFSGKPVATSTALIQSIQSSEQDIEIYEQLMTPEFMTDVVKFLVKLDRFLLDQYGSTGTQWLGREVNLTGLMGALGAIGSETPTEVPSSVMNIFIKYLEVNPKLLSIEKFEVARNSQDLSKVNIGNSSRTAVFKAVVDVMHTPTITVILWDQYFRSNSL